MWLPVHKNFPEGINKVPVIIINLKASVQSANWSLLIPA